MGSRELNALFLNRRLAVDLAVNHVVDRNLALLGASGLTVDEYPEAEWRLPEYAEPTPLAFLERRGLSTGGYAVVSPGTIWRTKLWHPRRFAEAVRRLGRVRGLPAVVVWAGDAERRAAQEIVTAAGEDCRVLLAPPTDLRELATLVRHAALFLGCDSGPAHLAAALNVPCVSVFGPTDPARNGPYGPRSAAVELDRRLDCQPCWRRTCSRGDFACMERLDAGRVVEACLAKLDG